MRYPVYSPMSTRVRQVTRRQRRRETIGFLIIMGILITLMSLGF